MPTTGSGCVCGSSDPHLLKGADGVIYGLESCVAYLASRIAALESQGDSSP